MKIFIAHASSYDFVRELYDPIKHSPLVKKYTFIYPMEEGNFQTTRDVIESVDCILAEVSFPSTGQGIELGWANIYEIPIICIYKKGNKYSSSLPKLTKTFITYRDKKDIINKISSALKKTTQ